MKRKIVLALFCICAAVLSFLYQNAYAYSAGEFYGDDIPEDEAARLIAYYDLKLEHDDNRLKSIECFDVREDGVIAVGSMQMLSRAHISVYDEDFNFIYGYSFKSEGSYGIMWDGNEIAIYFVRGSVIIRVNENGEITAMNNTADQSLEQGKIDSAFCAAKREKNGKVYQLGTAKGPFGIPLPATTYSTLCVSEGGESHLLIDESRVQVSRIIIIVSFVVIALIVFIVLMVLRIKGRRLSHER